MKVHALRGDRQKALSALRQAIDEGWRSLWWYSLKQDPNLESLHGEPEYPAMVAEIEADMAAQLARVREMERNGELEPIPEVSRRLNNTCISATKKRPKSSRLRAFHFLVAGEGFARVGATIDPESTPNGLHGELIRSG